MAKNFGKKDERSKFLGMLYKLKVIITSLNALSKTFQTKAINCFRIIINVLKRKTKLKLKRRNLQ